MKQMLGVFIVLITIINVMGYSSMINHLQKVLDNQIQLMGYVMLPEAEKEVQFYEVGVEIFDEIPVIRPNPNLKQKVKENE